MQGNEKFVLKDSWGFKDQLCSRCTLIFDSWLANESQLKIVIFVSTPDWFKAYFSACVFRISPYIIGAILSWFESRNSSRVVHLRMGNNNQKLKWVLLLRVNHIIGAEDKGKQVTIMHHQSCQLISSVWYIIYGKEEIFASSKKTQG